MMEEETECREILEGADLCLCCLEPVRPGASRCVKCGAPLDFFAATLPFLRVLAEGFVYHRAVQTPRSWWSVAGIWLIFGETAVGGLLSLWWWVPMVLEFRNLEFLIQGIPFIALTVVGVSGIAISTANYVAYRRSLRGNAL